MVAAGDWQQHMTDALEKALGHRLDSLALAIVQPLQSELRQLVAVMMHQVHSDVKRSANEPIARTDTSRGPSRPSPANRMPSPQPSERAGFSEQGREGKNCCDGENAEETVSGNPSYRGRRRRMALAAGHSVILTDRFQRNATPASAPRSHSPVPEDMVSVDHLAAAVAVMAEASAVALTDGSGWPRRLSSPPEPGPDEQVGAIYCDGGGGVANGTKHLLSSGFFSSSGIDKKKAAEPLVDSGTDTPLQLAEPGHPLSVLSPAAAEAAFAFGVALAREEELRSQSTAARALWQSMNQAVASNPSSWQRSNKRSSSRGLPISTVRSGIRDDWGKDPSPQRISQTGEIGWIQSAISSESDQLGARTG
jgi:hypothetical protein